MSEEGESDYQTEIGSSKVLPAYEHVKLNIIFHWFKVQSEIQRYIFFKSTNKIARVEGTTSMIFALYLTMLKSLMQKKGKKELIEELDKYIKADFTIEEKNIIPLVSKLEAFLYEVGYLNTTMERKPWQDDFKDSYGVF